MPHLQLLDRVFLDELRLSIGLERMRYSGSDRDRRSPTCGSSSRAVARRLDGQVSRSGRTEVDSPLCGKRRARRRPWDVSICTRSCTSPSAIKP